MATSEKQIAANRRNAKKSTGPRSPKGKAVASRNAIKHGLHACDIILKSPHLNEDSTQYEQLVDSLIDELKPKGILQEHLVLKIANSLWRYRRVINAETSRINRLKDQSSAASGAAGCHGERSRTMMLVWSFSPFDSAQGDRSSARSARNPFMGASITNSPEPFDCCTGCNSRPNPNPRPTPPQKTLFRETNPFQSHPKGPQPLDTQALHSFLRKDGFE